MAKNTGKLYLVSAGIGDVDNITIRAHKILENADIVFAMPFIQRIYSSLLQGKEVYDAGHAFFTDSNVNSAKDNDEDKVRKIIRDAYSQGKCIAILDFGDPTLYSPQSAYLREFSDLNPQVIPGISSFNAANAAIGQEITGKYEVPVVLTEAMECNERLDLLASTGATLIFFTMRMNLAKTVEQLKKHYAKDTPAIIVCCAGIREKEVVLRSTLDEIVDLAKARNIPWEHLLYVGDAFRS